MFDVGKDLAEAYEEGYSKGYKEGQEKADEKQIDMKPIETDDEGFVCPTCKGGCLIQPGLVDDDSHLCSNYCNECGQKLDWSDLE